MAKANPEPFIRKAIGHYELLVTENSPVDCPEAFEAGELSGDGLILINLDNSFERHQKKFQAINKGIQRTEYSLGSYIDRLAKLDEKTVTSYARLCEGLIMVECGKWVTNSTFTLTAGGAKVSVAPAGVKLDNSGFPVGTCHYLETRH
jgi:hypothetical protein